MILNDDRINISHLTKEKHMELSVKLFETEKEFIANCPELDINCYGSNKNEAIRRLKNVIQFYIKSAKELGLDIELFDEIVIDGKINKVTDNLKEDIPYNIN